MAVYRLASLNALNVIVWFAPWLVALRSNLLTDIRHGLENKAGILWLPELTWVY